MNTAKTTAYGHPRYPSADGLRYYRMERRDAARMVRDAKKARELDRCIGNHGQVIYRINCGPYESFRIEMTTNRRVQSAA